MICVVALTTSAVCAQVPATDLYLFQLSPLDTSWTIHSPLLLSGFNNGGYTNQPEFIADDLLYVSVRKAGEEQNDIYGLHLNEGKVERITATPESEYSPTRMPDRSSFSCVRQNDSDTVDQRLFEYPLDRNSNGTDLIPSHYNIGYHSWVTKDDVALFLVTELPTLAWANVETRESRRVLSNIGRCLRSGDAGELFYVHKYTDEVWYLKSTELQSKGSDIIIETLKGSEDFTISKDGTFFMGHGSQLYAYHPKINNSWKLVADLGVYGITSITRLTINNKNELVLVNVP